MLHYASTEIAGTSVVAVADGAFSNQIVEIEEIYISKTEFDSTGKPLTQNGDAPLVEAEKVEENLYECHHLTNGAKHPGKIVETPKLANIKPPRPTHRPRLPKNLI